jgi:hypothetical protein
MLIRSGCLTTWQNIIAKLSTMTGNHLKVHESEVNRLSSSFIPGSGTVVVAHCAKPKKGEKITTEIVELEERDIVAWRIGSEGAPYPVYLGMQARPELNAFSRRVEAVRQRDGKTYVDVEGGDLYDSLESIKSVALQRDTVKF